MSAKFTGPWFRVKGRLANAKPWLTGVTEEKLPALGAALVEEIRARMKASPPPPLAAATIARKTKEGAPYPTRTWYEWGTVVNADFRVLVSNTARGNVVNISFKQVNHPSGPKVTRIVEWLESGTSTQPPRPVFGPLSEDIREGRLDMLRSFTAELTRDLVGSF